MKLSDLPLGYTYIQETNTERLLDFRIKEVTDKSSAEAWLEAFSDHTKTTWRKWVTYPRSSTHNDFKVRMRCVHKTDRRASGKCSSKHTGCPANLTITIKRLTRISRPNITDAKLLEFPTIVSYKNIHNHEIDSAASLSCRDMAPAVAEKFLQLFLLGHSAGSALHCHKSDLILQHGENYYKIAEDQKFLPSYSKVYRLYMKEFRGKETSDKEVLKNVVKHVKKYREDTGGIAKFKRTKDKSHYFVVICTPIMIRAHEMLSQSSELVMVDGSSDVDNEKHRVYFFVSPCLAGGIPLGIIITDGKTEEIFTEALNCFQASLPPTAFFSKISPSVFMTDNDLNKVSILNKAFPSAEIVFSHFHLLKATWRWLMDSNHSISESKRRELFFLFRALLYSGDEATAKENLKNLISCAKQIEHNHFIIYITQLMKQKEMWINYFRVPLSGNSTINYGEIVFSILKDSILKRTTAFNVIQLVDYLVTRYEKYVQTRILDFCNGQSNSHLMKLMIPFNSSVTLHIIEEGNGNFIVSNEKDETFTVNFEIGICSCPAGERGKLCVHASAVILLLDKNITAAYDTIDEQFKSDLFYIAEGKSWLQPSSNDQIERDIAISSCFSLDEPTSNENDEPSTSSLLPSTSVDHEVCSLTFEEVTRLNSTFLTIQQMLQQGLENDPKNYVPAIKKFVSNAEKVTKTDAGLLTAMHTFGSTAEKHKFHVGVGAVALGLRKSSGKKARAAADQLSSSSKATAEQVYDCTTFGSKPYRKRKAFCNLQKYMDDTSSLDSKIAKL